MVASDMESIMTCLRFALQIRCSSCNGQYAQRRALWPSSSHDCLYSYAASIDATACRCCLIVLLSFPQDSIAFAISFCYRFKYSLAAYLKLLHVQACDVMCYLSCCYWSPGLQFWYSYWFTGWIQWLYCGTGAGLDCWHPCQELSW